MLLKYWIQNALSQRFMLHEPFLKSRGCNVQTHDLLEHYAVLVSIRKTAALRYAALFGILFVGSALVSLALLVQMERASGTSIIVVTTPLITFAASLTFRVAEYNRLKDNLEIIDIIKQAMNEDS